MLRSSPAHLLAATLLAATVSYPVGADSHRAPPSEEQPESAANLSEEDCHCTEAPRQEVLPSRSTGYPWRGRLREGIRLDASDTIHLMEVDVPRGNFFGTRSLVNLLRRASERVEVDAPGARLNVGELSRRGGGNIMGHRSHENGRDVDIGFYLKDEAGVPYEPRRFVEMNRQGQGRDAGQRVFFDDARNWLLMKALVTDGVAVQHAFVHRSLRRRILDEGARQGASAELLAKVERVVISPGVSHPHRNHFHVRIYCPAADVPACRDRGPYWPWLPSDHPFTARIVSLPGWPPGE